MKEVNVKLSVSDLMTAYKVLLQLRSNVSTDYGDYLTSEDEIDDAILYLEELIMKGSK